MLAKKYLFCYTLCVEAKYVFFFTTSVPGRER